MKKALVLFGVALCAFVGVQAEEKADCLKEGDGVAAFNVVDVTGPSAGEKLCYRCRYGARPVVSIFARDVDDKVASLVKEVDTVVGKNKEEKKMAAFVVLLSDNPDDQTEKLKTMAAKKEIKDTPLTTFEGTAGPPEYKIQKDAEVTVMMWVDGKVKVNEVVKKSDLSKEKIASIVKNTDKILN
jgi:hypothetical protein